jgi:hypothetical protein
MYNSNHADHVSDVTFLVPTLLHEDAKRGSGKAWLSDELITGTIKKYSGTDQAGSHPEEDAAGSTCDALAHWSLETTENEIVFVDIQGKSIIQKISDNMNQNHRYHRRI